MYATQTHLFVSSQLKTPIVVFVLLNLKPKLFHFRETPTPLHNVN